MVATGKCDRVQNDNGTVSFIEKKQRLQYQQSFSMDTYDHYIKLTNLGLSVWRTFGADIIAGKPIRWERFKPDSELFTEVKVSSRHVRLVSANGVSWSGMWLYGNSVDIEADNGVSRIGLQCNLDA